LRLGRDGDADDVLHRARARFGDTPELRMLVARQLLHRSAFVAAEEALAPLTDDPDRPRAAAAWAWIAVARLSRGDEAGAAAASHESLLIDPHNAVAASVAEQLRGR
jgi:predicted Zn-dependent protease